VKVEMVRRVTVDVDAIRVRVPVRYDEELEEIEAALRGTGFGLVNRTLTMVLDLDTRRVRDWPTGRTLELHLKVVDTGTYDLLSGDDTVATREQSYVPGVLPGEHYGDYLILSISEDGSIGGWNPTPRDLTVWQEGDE
jgi:hypothetical protein